MYDENCNLTKTTYLTAKKQKKNYHMKNTTRKAHQYLRNVSISHVLDFFRTLLQKCFTFPMPLKYLSISCPGYYCIKIIYIHLKTLDFYVLIIFILGIKYTLLKLFAKSDPNMQKKLNNIIWNNVKDPCRPVFNKYLKKRLWINNSETKVYIDQIRILFN